MQFWDLLCWSDYHEVTSTIYAQTLGVQSLGLLLYMTHSGRGRAILLLCYLMVTLPT